MTIDSVISDNLQIQQTFQALANSPTLLDSNMPSSPLFAPIDSLTTLLLDTNICPFLPKLYGIYKSVEDINFSTLPRSFVLKTNHGSGEIVIVRDKEKLNRADIISYFQKAISIKPEHIAAHEYAAEVFLLTGDKEMALKHKLIAETLRNKKNLH